MTNTKKDFYLVTLIGFIVGWLVLIPAHTALKFEITAGLIAASVLGFSVLAPCALAVLKLLSRRWKVFEQFGKFAAVGTLNVLLDLCVVNVLIALLNQDGGWWFRSFKALSFLVATTNSYFWNKFWTFGSTKPVTGGEYLRFAMFTLVGFFINVGVATLVRDLVPVPAGIDTRLWANIAVLVAVLASFLWNFLSYRLVVFKGSVSAPGGQDPGVRP